MANEYIDLQVNGGGGALFNNAPTMDTIKRMVDAHVRFGTKTLYPTLITDSREKIATAIDSVRDYINEVGIGVGGIHLEGPFISPQKAGVHSLQHITQMTESDFELVTSLDVGRTIITVAPENVGPAMIRRLVDKGLIVSLGHSNATFRDAMEAFDAGASMVTHLFNAMSQIQGREPGLVGAALNHPNVRCGIIADGYHVHYSNIKLAFELKGPDRLFLVTDSMATVGTAKTRFAIYGEEVLVQDGRCITHGGTLAGSALTMKQAVQNCIEQAAIMPEDAHKMATPSF